MHDDPAGRAEHGGPDRLTVRGIEAFGHHGVFDFERREGQVFVVDLVLGLDTRAAAGSDDLRDTVDYGNLVATVKRAIESDPVDLIETLAARIADVCLADPRVGWAEVTVHKPNAPVDAAFSDIALTITRRRAPATIAQPAGRPATGPDAPTTARAPRRDTGAQT
jgi:dihydroneopterin aldolase